MRLLSLSARGIGPAFRASEFKLDLAAIHGKLLAVVGQNGAGKSTLLGCWPGALFRDVPTRGSLVDLAKAAGSKDAYVEAHVETPTPYRIRISTDGTSSEAFVTNGDGKPLLPSTSVKAFDAWAAKHLPLRSVFESTVFTAQGGSGWVGMSAAERKAVILRTLGIERLEALAEKAREHGRSTADEIERLTQVLEIERRATSVDRAEEDVANARSNAAAAAAGVEAEAVALAEARARHERLVAAFRDAEAARRTRGDAEAALTAATFRMDGLRAKAQRQRAALADADAVRAAVAALLAREEAVRQAVAVESEAVEKARGMQRDLDVAIRANGDATRRRMAATKRAAEAQGAGTELEACRVRAAEVPGLRAEFTRRCYAEAEVEREIDALREATHDVTAARLGSALGSLEQISAGDFEEPSQPREIAAAALDRDTVRRLAAEDAPAKLTDAKKRHAVLRDDADTTRQSLAAAERLAARIPDLERAAAAHAEAVAELEAADRDVKLSSDAVGESNRAIASHRTTVDTATDARRAAEQRAARVRLKAAAAPAIAAAEAALAEVESQIPAAQEAVSAAQASFDAAPEPPADVPLPPDLASLEQRLADAEALAETRRGAVAVAEKALATAHEAVARIATLDAERKALDEDRADWTKLGEDLGQRGLIAMEVDAAGPELSTLATSLVHATFGTRWCLTIETTRPKADGSGSVEVCDVRVLDTVDGTEVPIEKKSGGQLVILSQAVRLALMTIACRRSGVTGATLVLDESGAALDEESRPAFVAMLRRAAALVNADKVLIVTHDSSVAELCDARVRVADGRVTVN